MDARTLLPHLEDWVMVLSEQAEDARKRVQVTNGDDDCALLLLHAVMTAKAMQLASLACVAHEVSAGGEVVRSFVVAMRKSLCQWRIIMQSLRMLDPTHEHPLLDAMVRGFRHGCVRAGFCPYVQLG